MSSGKCSSFTGDILQRALKKYIKEEEQIERFVEMVEFLIWKHFRSTLSFELLEFELMCEKLLGRKLVKDSKQRNSKITVKNMFDSLYKEGIAEV